MAKIIAVTNQKGGVGKTTTCVNLSSCMAALGKRILVVDIDPQGNCTSGFGLKAQDDRSTYEALLDPDSAADCIMKTCVDNLEIMPSGMQLAGAEIELIGMVGTALCNNLKNIRDGKNKTRPALHIEEIYEYDLDSTSEELDEYCRKADFVFNLAGVNRPENPEDFMKGNFGFASDLLNCLKKHAQRGAA